ncbi:MAG: class I SAM-dependent methyltransferase [Pseudohongiellaceae bacterium]
MTDNACQDRARSLAESLSAELVADDSELAPGTAFVLQYDDTGLGLRMTARHAPGKVRVDFTSPQLSYRVADAVRKQAIARAVGIKPGMTPSVIDATAGFGKDAFLLSALGCPVLMIERSPIVYALLQDGLQRALTVDDDALSRGNTVEAARRLSLRQGVFEKLGRAGLRADVVYLDPMFPPRAKTARVKKDLYVLQQFLGHEPVSPDLLSTALRLAGRRVVVKRPRLAEPLCATNPSASSVFGSRSPDFSLTGKTSRYDVYLTG